MAPADRFGSEKVTFVVAASSCRTDVRKWLRRAAPKSPFFHRLKNPPTWNRTTDKMKVTVNKCVFMRTFQVEASFFTEDASTCHRKKTLQWPDCLQLLQIQASEICGGATSSALHRYFGNKAGLHERSGRRSEEEQRPTELFTTRLCTVSYERYSPESVTKWKS
ncbi:unnamed protein product [Pleuronectes platessa]|uniref:Uncharacterized protein n=1 Tax=Pleuronectes platessa TaxID=8262 RepID=A0A9N7VPN8_PLEPL|nr:unnamed protein product [Pleuronectes platessa]